MGGTMMPLKSCGIEPNTQNETYSRIIVKNVQLRLLAIIPSVRESDGPLNAPQELL
jgi:hypothetical protein